MAKAPYFPHPGKLAQYQKLVSTKPEIQRKGATVPYTAVNGNMFSYLSKEGKRELRLPPDAIDAFSRNIRRSSARHTGSCRRDTWKCRMLCSRRRRT